MKKSEENFGKISKSKLIKEINKLFDRIESPYIAIKIVKSRFTSDQYEGGAWRWKAICHPKTDETSKFELLSSASFEELEGALNNGKKLRLSFNGHSRFVITDYEISYS